MKGFWQRIVTNRFVFFTVLISFFSMYEIAVAEENQVPNHERLGSLEEKIRDLNAEIEKLKNENKPPTPEQQKYIGESISAAIKGLELHEQAIRIYSAKADISNILLEHSTWIVTLMFAISGIIFGVSGLVAFRFLERELKNKLQSEATELGNVIVVEILKIIGHTHWRGYDERKNEADLQIALECARRALQHTNKIQDKEKYETEITDAKNNAVYYWLEQKELDDKAKSRIREYAEDVLKVSTKEKHQEGNDWYEWRDTYIWSLLMLEPDTDKRRRAEGMLKELIADYKVPREWLTKTLGRYGGHFGWTKYIGL